MILSFVVYGDPKPAGSKRAFRWAAKDGRQGVSIADANPNSKGWKQEVARAAAFLMASHLGILEGPLRLTLGFYRIRPKAHYKRDGKTLSKKGLAEPYPTAPPDVLKLARGVEDSLSKVVYRDDKQIVDEHLTKDWGVPARVEIKIETLDLLDLADVTVSLT